MRFSFAALPPVVAILMIAVMPSAVLARTAPGFRPVDTREEGITIYQKNRDIVQVLDPSKGARLRVMVGEESESGSLLLYERHTLPTWWKKLRSTHPNAISALNAGFFDMRYSPAAPLSFSVKAEGRTYEGFADRTEYFGQKKVLLLDDDRHTMRPFHDDASDLGLAPEREAVVGLDPAADKSARRRIGRTVVGVTGDGKTLLFSSARATQRYATRILQAFGATPSQIMLLDGGASSQLVLRGSLVVPQTRTRSNLRQVPNIVLVETAR